MPTSRAKPKGKLVKVAAAKGRPMLTWVGKRPLAQVTAFPAQHVETFDPTGELDKPRADEIWNDWPDAYPRGGLLFHGDNKEVLAHLLANGFRGKVDLIYIDPPFDSGADYVRRVSLRGDKGTAKIEGESYTLGEQIQYTDIWANDEYLQFMFERLLLLKELLANKGSLWLHCDWHKVHHLRSLLDEVFGADNLRNEIVWRYSKYQMRGMTKFVNNHDILYWYSKGDRPSYNPLTEPLETPKRLKRKQWDKERGKIVNVRDASGQLIYDEYEEEKVDDVWDLDIIGATSGERTDYPTQKPTILLERILQAASDPGDIILDCFAGSGSTLVAAQTLGRRWIACDINKGAIQTTAKRLQDVIMGQVNGSAQGTLTDGELAPPQLSVTTWRVNDYDLQIHHNEAVELACEHIGIQRTRTDPFFDGTLGKNLTKIIPFTHPLSPVDLEAIKKEFEARPEEDRSVTLVCLGIELGAKKWIEDWNRLRRGKNAVNKIDYIELRSDSKHGGFIKHEPATARVNIERKAGKIVVRVEDFVSPSIIERLRLQTGITNPKIDDWKAMVDSVMIDTAYDGKVFNVTLSDVPVKKQALVEGRYEISAPKAKTMVAVKIIDMLGEEVLVVKEL